MAIYGKTTRQMLVDLINEGNPDLPFPINDTDFDFTMPEVIADPGNGHNTRVRVIAKAGTNYTGNVLVTYRRLTIGTIFRNMILELEHWVPNTGANNNVINNIYNLLPLFSEKFGLNFEAGPDFWNNQNLTGMHGVNGNTFNITASANNWAYIGSVQARWLVGERTLDSLLPNDIVDGRLYPGGNDLDDTTRKYWVTPDGFDIDHTINAANLNSTDLTRVPLGLWQDYNQTAMQTFFINTILPQVIPRDNNKGLSAYVGLSTVGVNNENDPNFNYKTRVGGVNGLQLIRVTLPNAAYPEANSEFFNRCLVLNFPADCPWAMGRLYFHYNV